MCTSRPQVSFTFCLVCVAYTKQMKFEIVRIQLIQLTFLLRAINDQTFSIIFYKLKGSSKRSSLLS